MTIYTLAAQVPAGWKFTLRDDPDKLLLKVAAPEAQTLESYMDSRETRCVVVEVHTGLLRKVQLDAEVDRMARPFHDKVLDDSCRAEVNQLAPLAEEPEDERQVIIGWVPI
jgi:hypothetical protein